MLPVSLLAPRVLACVRLPTHDTWSRLHVGSPCACARFLRLEGDVRDVTGSLQPLPSCMEAADVLSASLTCPTGTADRGVRHICRSTEACTMPSCPTAMHDMFQ